MYYVVFYAYAQLPGSTEGEWTIVLSVQGWHMQLHPLYTSPSHTYFTLTGSLKALLQDTLRLQGAAVTDRDQ